VFLPLQGNTSRKALTILALEYGQGQFSKLSISNIKFTANGSHKGFAKIGDYLKLKTL
jgi:hypothetical protein